MRRLLIVSPHFPPVNAPDMQRARQCLPYLAENGWEAEILAVDPRDIAAATDPLLQDTLPPDVRVHQVRAPQSAVEALLNSTTLGRRARRAFARVGPSLLADNRFDLALFTTSQFSALRVGPEWKRRHGLRYVIDWQDPWRKSPPASANLRRRIAQREALRHERTCVIESSAMLATSEIYLRELRERYPDVADRPAATIPFGVEPRDFSQATAVSGNLFANDRNKISIVSIGAAGPIMHAAIRALFAGLRKARELQPAQAARLRLWFIGTSYAPAGTTRPSVAPVAAEFDLADAVTEMPERIGHFAALRAMSEANALVVLGSDSPDYVPSKLATVAFAAKPTLGIVAAGSECERHLGTLGCATMARHSPHADTDAIADFLLHRPLRRSSPATLDGLTAQSRTRELCRLLDQAFLRKTS